jgi:hypothetical protein
MNANKINEQIERLEQELAKLKAEANKPSKYELKYKDGNAFFISIKTVMGEATGQSNGLLKTGRYRTTEKFANKHFKTQNEMMRLGALVEAVTIELGMEDWVEDWNNEDQTKYCVRYDEEYSRYGLDWGRDIRITGVIYMPQKVAERVCEILNNKEYELSGVNYGDRT